MKKLKRFLTITFSGIAVLVALLFLAYKFTPWPAALVIRYYFNKEGVRVNEVLSKKVPPGISSILDQQYIKGDKDAMLDVYYPSVIDTAKQLLPVIVWIHGGGWIAGSKAQVANYCKLLASKGYSVIAIDYSLAPEHRYPKPLKQSNAALEFINKNAQRFHADTARFILAGDSGGAQIAAQTAGLISNDSYADMIGIKAGISRNQLSGLILYCGAYDASRLDRNGSSGIFLNTVLWSYTGKKDFEKAPLFETTSVINFLRANYPPCFISVGNDDPLLSHSVVLAEKLTELKVPVDSLFFKPDYKPALPHEYQFNLDEAAGVLALERSVKFLDQVTRKDLR
jgi:acetyl esterase